MSNNSKHISPDTWTAIAATVIAVIALAVAVWQGFESRKHNRLSVKPAMAFLIQKAKGKEPVGLSLKNHGAGPAFIRKFTIWIDGKAITSITRGGWAEATLRMGLANILFRTGSVTQKTVFAPGDERFLFGIKPENQTTENVERFRNAISSHKLRVEVIYASLYDEEFSASHSNWQSTETITVPKETIKELREQTNSPDKK